MLTLTVIRFNGHAPAAPLTATFDTAGGTIGRADSNRLVLEDAERTVSRVHAQIVWREGEFRLIDRGSNPALVNGRALEPGQEVTVGDGDEVQIGGYQLHASVSASAAFDAFPATEFSSSDTQSDPFADLFGEPQAARAPKEAEELDELFRPAPAPLDAIEPTSPKLLADDFDFGFDDPASNRSIDELFDLGAGTDARGLSPIDDPLSAPNTSGDGDPFTNLTAPRRHDAPPPTVSDSGSELHSAFAPPRTRRAQPPEEAPPGTRETRADDAQALAEAFLRGLDAPGVRIDALTPELMERVGALLHEATHGTLDLLAARAATKREMRSEATIIAASENNPLKFSPNVETALAHLLQPPARGFMPGALALQEAYDDLRAHQVGFIAGMRAALDGVFERFEPAKIEARLTERSLLDALLPQLNRRARCWTLFAELYGDLSQEAAEDFHTHFGRAFIAAYEAQIDRLKDQRGWGR
jgi:type VI secretion system FHA domain protein